MKMDLHNRLILNMNGLNKLIKYECNFVFNLFVNNWLLWKLLKLKKKFLFDIFRLMALEFLKKFLPVIDLLELKFGMLKIINKKILIQFILKH